MHSLISVCTESDVPSKDAFKTDGGVYTSDYHTINPIMGIIFFFQLLLFFHAAPYEQPFKCFITIQNPNVVGAQYELEV